MRGRVVRRRVMGRRLVRGRVVGGRVMASRRALAGLLVAGLLAGGCGVRPTGVVSAGAAPIATATSAPQAEVFMLENGAPVPVRRTVPPWDPQAVVEALVAGPTAAERAGGLRSDLPGEGIFVQPIGSRELLVESPAQSLSAGGYLQIYCTIRLLSWQPVMKIPEPTVFTASPDDYCKGVPVPAAHSTPQGARLLPGRVTKPGVAPYPSGATPTPDPAGVRKRKATAARSAGK